MLDHILRRLADPPLNRISLSLCQLGVSPNSLTITGFCIGLLAIPAISYHHYYLAMILILVNRIFDGLDGAVARQISPTDLGGYLDIVFDFIVYSGVVFAFALADHQNALYSALLLFSFMGTASSFLAYAIIAAKRDITTTKRGLKAFYYLGGLAEGTETIIFMIISCVWPDYFKWFAIGFSIVCWITTISRILIAALAFKN